MRNAIMALGLCLALGGCYKPLMHQEARVFCQVDGKEDVRTDWMDALVQVNEHSIIIGNLDGNHMTTVAWPENKLVECAVEYREVENHAD